jgi:hypothetical protein
MMGRGGQVDDRARWPAGGMGRGGRRVGWGAVAGGKHRGAVAGGKHGGAVVGEAAGPGGRWGGTACHRGARDEASWQVGDDGVGWWFLSSGLFL